MSESVGAVQLDLETNPRSFNKQLNSIARNAESSVGSAFKGLGKTIVAAFAVKGLFDFSKGAIGLASNLGEVQNVVDVTFGSMSENINNFAKAALKNFGMSELSAKKFSSTMGAMLKSSGLGGQQMLQMSKGVTALAGDMASFYNLEHQEAFDKIRAGLSGETEPLRQLGINMSVANLEAYAMSKGIKKSYQEMTQAEQTLLRYNYLLNSTKDAQGDFARTSDSWANQTRLLSEQWKIFQTTMGQGFITMLTPMIQGLNLFIGKLQLAAQYFKAFIDLIYGAKKSTSQTAVSTEEMGEAAGGVGKSVKKAGKDVKGSLSAFDQLNVIAQSTAGAMDEVSGGAADMSVTDPGTTPVAPDLGIDPAVFQPFLDILNQVKTVALEVGKHVADIFGPAVQSSIKSIVTEALGWKDSLVSVFKGVKEAAEPVLKWLANDGLKLVASFMEGGYQVLASISNTIRTTFDTLFAGVLQPSFMLLSQVTLDSLDMLKGFWNTFGTDIVNGISLAFNNITMTFMNWWTTIFQPVWETALGMLKWLWESHLSGLIQQVMVFIGKLVTGALDIYNKFIIPLVNWFIKLFGPGIRGAFQTVIDVLGTVIGTISDVVKGIFKILGGIIDFIVGVFTGDWKRAWTGVKDIFGGIFDSVVGILKGALNLIIDAINTMIRGLNNIKVNIPDWVPGFGGKSFGISIPTIPKLAQGGLVTGPTLAMVGDNRNATVDPEVVTPLSKLQEMLGSSNQMVVEVLLAILDAIERKETSLEIDGETLTRIVKRYMDAENNRVGKKLITVGGVGV